MTKVVDGFVLSKNEGEQLATLASKNKDGSFVSIKSNQLNILDDFFEYTKHIDELLKDEYLVRAKEELTIIEARFKYFSATGSNIVNSILSIDRYIVSAKRGASVLTIQRPSMPQKVSPQSSLMLAISIFLGGLVGVMYVLISNAFRKRKENFT